jgi:hypothetical protein
MPIREGIRILANQSSSRLPSCYQVWLADLIHEGIEPSAFCRREQFIEFSC